MMRQIDWDGESYCCADQHVGRPLPATCRVFAGFAGENEIAELWCLDCVVRGEPDSRGWLKRLVWRFMRHNPPRLRGADGVR